MIIPGRFNGPPGSGNGGYTSGRVASYVDAPAVRVRLHRPPPLDTVLQVHPATETERLRVFDEDRLVASAEAADVEEPVPGVPLATATRASTAYAGFVEHPFPTCYVCGPQRGDGLAIYPGRLTDGRTAAPFVVPADVTVATVWAALDCPGGWTVPLETRAYVLGEFTVRVDAVPAPGAECVVVGEMTGEDGRKAYARTTLYSPTGDPLAIGQATWIAI